MDKRFHFILLITIILLSGCAPTNQLAAAQEIQTVTEVPCPGVKPTGLTTGIQAYLQISSNQVWFLSVFQEPSSSSKIVEKIYHHTRVKLTVGPKCAESSAWWQVSDPNGQTGWVEVGGTLMNDGDKFSASLIPFRDDAVQREVSEVQSLDAQVRYILADIQLGGKNVLQYYLDETAAKPGDAELIPVRIALEIQKEWGKDDLLANPTVFERKPIRGGTSVVDAGTDFVQPGLDILLQPCDVKTPVVSACQKLNP